MTEVLFFGPQACEGGAGRWAFCCLAPSVPGTEPSPHPPSPPGPVREPAGPAGVGPGRAAGAAGDRAAGSGPGERPAAGGLAAGTSQVRGPHRGPWRATSHVHIPCGPSAGSQPAGCRRARTACVRGRAAVDRVGRARGPIPGGCDRSPAPWPWWGRCRAVTCAVSRAAPRPRTSSCARSLLPSWIFLEKCLFSESPSHKSSPRRLLPGSPSQHASSVLPPFPNPPRLGLSHARLPPFLP